GTIMAKLMPVEGVRKPDPSDVLTVDEAIKVALENRPEMKQFQLDLENKNMDYQYTKNQLLPTIDLIGSYTQTGVGGTPICTPTLPPNVKCTPITSPGGGFFFPGGNTTINPDLIGGLGTAFG